MAPIDVTATALTGPYMAVERHRGFPRCTGPKPAACRSRKTLRRRGAIWRHRHGTRPSCVWPWSVIFVLAVARSQTRSVSSAEPETARRPSGVTATAVTR